ncbi:ATP-binding protein [Chondrinema litorale]|uniref:ATP-binding protein n=1 Tax=Chondrinema litorale TaxID=2994555 RepID=UPI002542B373|nr:ATP-binding protein [Chondrinema litorale]UZR98630.1 PAS domain S-box protein [Chondrinema litorale]
MNNHHNEQYKIIKTNLDAIIQESPVPLILLDKKLNILYANQNASELYGYKMGMAGLSFYNLLSKKPKKEDPEFLFSLDEHKHLDENLIYVGVKYTEYQYENEQCYILQINDISEVKKHQHKIKDLIEQTHLLSATILKSQTELLNKESRLNSLLQSQNNFLIRIDPDGKYTFANYSFLSKFRFRESELLQKELFQIIYNEDRNICKEAINFCLNNPGKIKTVNLRIFLSQEHIAVIEWEFYGILGAGNKITEIQAVGRDITLNLNTQEKLQKTLALFTSVFNESSDALFIVDSENSTILDCNDRSVTLFDFESKEEIIGKSSNDFEVNLRSQLKSLKSTKDEEISKELLLKSNKNEHFWGLVVSKNIPYLNEKITLLKITDITDKKRKEEEISALLSKTLIYNQQLETNNNELNKLNTEMDNFVYRVSHDLRAPIASTMGLVDLAKEETNLQKIQQYLDLQNQSLGKLDAFIQDIMDYSRNNRQEVEKENINLKDLMTQQISQFYFGNVKEEISINNNISEDFNIISDHRRLSVIFGNVLSNAIRYSNTRKTDSYINIGAELTDEFIFVIVEDNGIGIAEEYLDEIFKMFFRVGDVGKNGSGLGLYIVKETLEKLKGSIDVTSTSGKGSTFTIKLPIN